MGRTIASSLLYALSLYHIFFSPYAASINGNNGDEVSVCGDGRDQGFSFVLEPGRMISIKQQANNFDSKHTLRYGGRYPGESEVACVDDPETSELAYTNYETVAVKVYFVVDEYSLSDISSDFLLEWEIGFARYALVSSGTCQSNNRDDVPQEDCVTAAVAVGLLEMEEDTEAGDGSDTDYPPGCYQHNNGNLYFNLAESSIVRCGTSGDNCLCGALGTESCDASELLPNAESVGDCSADLPSGGSCTNTAPISGFLCSPTLCFDGVLTPGTCLGTVV